MASSGRLLVAAIDFGTTYSGYAFSFRHEFETDPLKVSASTWTAGSRALVSLKTPTTVLLDKDKNFHSFGYEAEDYYSQLAEDDDHGDWYYFRRFKMMLYGKEGKGGLTRNIPLKDIRDKELPALKVFSEAIKYLKGHLLKALEKRATDVKDTDIEWVLTVPAIWNDPAKQFMREAAEVAGIKSDQLTIALEPEAASLYCKHLPVEKMGGSEQGFTCFSKGSKYLVLDAGGGTVDITVHKVRDDGTLKELDRASGGAWGGTQVDEAFKQMIIKIVGNPTMQQFCHEQTSDFVDMFREFETKKRCSLEDTLSKKVTMKIPIALKELFEDETEEDIKDVVRQSSYAGKLEWIGDKIRIAPDTFQSLFNCAITDTVSHIQDLLSKPSCEGTKTIIMVGGFSESPLLQRGIREAFPQMRIVIPYECGLSVLKGAVIFGHRPKTISARKAKCTYGISTNKKFKPSRHDHSKKKTVNGVDYCTELFDKHVRVGTTLKIGQAQSDQKYNPLYENQTCLDFPVYQSSEEDPDYVTDGSCTYMGNMSVTIPDTAVGTDKSVRVKMIFGGTELKLEAIQESTGKVTEAKFNFLGD
ncbi:heat shock 70 kDa protein 12A-like isoform X2 [Mizuhopecten yessoensis]|uniref:heat shock 70 kDa protein 12A-like isoform X2 n=1 Tax=Mizuhopecten yessoensis TaxID=6573 RepID=UPI000B458B06|nr:heat shock 70 kDa protein 12A-like isoform X2 [Mizuhopecten yessoensis]